jgi:hypothetical protein
MSLTDDPQQTHPTGERRADAVRARDAVWPPSESAEERAARVVRNLATLDALPKWDLDPAVVRQIVEDPDNDYFGS